MSRKLRSAIEIDQECSEERAILNTWEDSEKKNQLLQLVQEKYLRIQMNPERRHREKKYKMDEAYMLEEV